jgi:hypothetical protein
VIFEGTSALDRPNPSTDAKGFELAFHLCGAR